MDLIIDSQIKQTLSRDGKAVWSDYGQSDTGRISSWKSPTMQGQTRGEVYTSFPNADFLPGEFVPGNYVYRISYLESNGKAVEKSIEFSITEPITSGLSIEEVRENLRKVSKDTLSKVDDLFGEPEGDEPRIFNQRELTWLVEYDRMTEKEEYSLTNQQLIKLLRKMEFENYT